jgi:hypothetical protein
MALKQLIMYPLQLLGQTQGTLLCFAEQPVTLQTCGTKATILDKGAKCTDDALL